MNRKIDLRRSNRSDSNVYMQCIEDDELAKEFATQVSYEAIYILTNRLLNNYNTVLDVGSGDGSHSEIFRWMGKPVTTVEPNTKYPADVRTDFLEWNQHKKFDLVFCSHVLEHQRNVGLFLDKLIECCRSEGLIAITVPPEISHHFLLCHPNQFTAGNLIYHIVMAGIDCRYIFVLTYGYNTSIIFQNYKHNLQVQSWAYEMECQKYFPEKIKFRDNQAFGPVSRIDWSPRLELLPHMNAGIPCEMLPNLCDIA